MKNLILIFALAVSSISASQACTVTAYNGKVATVSNNKALSPIGNTICTLKVKPNPMDEFFDKNNLDIQVPGVYNGIEAIIQPSNKKLYQPRAGGVEWVFKNSRIVATSNQYVIGTAKDCTANEALLGAYAAAVLEK